jgi:hypothetical protein
MSASVLQMAGILVACGGAAAGLVLRDPRLRYAAVGVGLAAAVALIAGEVWDQERFRDLRSQPGVIVLGALLAGVALGATAVTFERVPAAFAIAAFAVLPLRVPVRVGDETNFLLVPLYGVIAGGWLRALLMLRRGRMAELKQHGSPRSGESPASKLLCWALAASLVVYGVGVAWSEDVDNAIRTVAFFLTPFAALLALLRDVRWHRKLLGQVLLATVLVAFAFAALALYQHATRDLLLNKDLKDANQLHLYFRVNSLFRDPNVLGRYLVFAIIALAAWFAWRRPTREALGGFAVCAVLLAALALTYSLTSFVALIAGLGVLAWFRLGLPGLAAAAALGAVAAVVVSIAGGPPDDDVGRQQDLAEVSSGRTSLISGGRELFEQEPLIGQGSGAFAISFRKKVEQIKRPVSHTEPITVAAEQGILGLLPYAAVLLLSVAVVARPWPSVSPERAAAAACYSALLVHTLGYAGFLIDPATWALLALGLVLRE